MQKRFQRGLSILTAASMLLGMSALASVSADTENDAPDKTIIEFRSDGKNEIYAKAGDKLPVSIYVPQCSGAHTIMLKMTVNGTDTLGVGVEETPDVLEDIRRNGEGYEDVEHWLFGNYGIKTENEHFASPYCFDSGIYQDGLPGGNAKLSMSYFLSNTWNVSLILNTFVDNGSNADAYAPWAAAGKPDEYDDYTPVTTWTKDVAWAYDYALAEFDLVLPENLADGVYVVDVLRDKYINTVSHRWAQSSVFGEQGDAEYETVPLKIVVGNVPTPTTTAPAETTQPTETTTTVTAGKKGDVNGDGTVNLKDVVLVRRYIANGFGVTLDETIADVNGDGKVNLKDAVVLRRYIAGGWGIEL